MSGQQLQRSRRSRGTSQHLAMRPLTFHMLATELVGKAAETMPDWWRRIDEDPAWRSYSECASPHCTAFSRTTLIAAAPL